MFAPAEIPVAAGKKIANAVQNPVVGVNADGRLCTSVSASNCITPPTRNETTESSRIASTMYWAFMATSAPLKVSTNSPATTAEERN